MYADEDDEDEATGENHIWENIQTIESNIYEKDFNLEHTPEGSEDNSDNALKVSAVREHDWFMDGCSDTAREVMMDAVYYGSQVCAVHQYFADSEPEGRQRTIRVDPLAIYWDPDAKNDFFDAGWVSYSELLHEAEIEQEWSVKLKGDTSEVESDYSLDFVRRMRHSTPDDTDKQDKARIHYFWLYDTTMTTEEIPVLDIVEVPLTEEIRRPATGLDGERLNPKDLGFGDDAVVVIDDEVVYFQENAQLTDQDGNPETVPEYQPRLNDKGKPVVQKRTFRKYPFGRLIVFTGSNLVYDGKNPYRLDYLRQRTDAVAVKFPIWWVHANKIPGQVWGRSYIEVLKEDQISINISQTQIRLNAQFTGNSPIFIEKSRVLAPKETQVEELNLKSDTVVWVKGNPATVAHRLKQESLSVQHLDEKVRKIEAQRDKVGTNTQLIRGVAPASDPANKTEFLSNLALRRMVKFFRSMQDALVRWEELRLSLAKQFGYISPPKWVDVGGKYQNVEFDPEMLDQYHAKIRMKVTDTDLTRKERQQAKIARTLEQAGQALANVPGAVQTLLEVYLESMEIEGFNEKLEKNAKAQIAREAQQQGGGNGNAPETNQSGSNPQSVSQQ